MPAGQKPILAGIGWRPLRRDIATAERVLGDRFVEVRDTVEKLRTRDRKTTGRKRVSE